MLSSLTFIFVVNIEVLTWCSLFDEVTWEYVNLIWVVHWLCAITWVMVFFLDSNNRLHSALLLSERKMNLMSHWCYLIVSMMSAQIVFQSIEENVWPEVFLEWEPSKVFFSFIASDVWRLLFSCIAVRASSCLACLKDLNNLIFWFLIAACEEMHYQLFLIV
jgi:hypothetical protein